MFFVSCQAVSHVLFTQINLRSATHQQPGRQTVTLTFFCSRVTSHREASISVPSNLSRPPVTSITQWAGACLQGI